MVEPHDEDLRGMDGVVRHMSPGFARAFEACVSDETRSEGPDSRRIQIAVDHS